MNSVEKASIGIQCEREYSPPPTQEAPLFHPTHSATLRIHALAQQRLVVETSPMGTLPIELLTLITNHLAANDWIHLAPTSKSLYRATLFSCKNKEESLVRAYVDILLNEIEKDTSLEPEKKNDLKKALFSWKEDICKQIAEATHVAPIEQALHTARASLAKLMAKERGHLIQKAYLATKPLAFNNIEKLVATYILLEDAQASPEGGRVHLPFLFFEFLELQETEQALLLIDHVTEQNFELDIFIFKTLLSQLIERGKIYRAFQYISQSIKNPYLQLHILDRFTLNLMAHPLLFAQLETTLIRNLSLQRTQEEYIKDTLLLAILYFQVKKTDLNYSTLVHFSDACRHCEELKNAFLQMPTTLWLYETLVSFVLNQYLETQNFVQAMACIALFQTEPKRAQETTHLFFELVEKNQTDLALKCIQTIPIQYQEQCTNRLVEQYLSLGTIQQALTLIRSHIHAPWAKLRYHEYILRLIDRAQWIETLQTIELFSQFPIAIDSTLDLCLSLIRNQQGPIFEVLIKQTFYHNIRDLLILGAASLAHSQQNIQLIQELQRQSTFLHTQQLLMAILSNDLALKGQIEQAIQEARKIQEPHVRLPALFNISTIVLSSPFPFPDHVLKQILFLTSLTPLEELIHAIRKQKEVFRLIVPIEFELNIHIGQEDVQLFITHFAELLSLMRQTIGETYEVQQGEKILEQFKAKKEEFPSTE